MNEEEIRLKLQMLIDGGQAVEGQLRAVLVMEQQLLEMNERQRAAAAARTEATKAAGAAAAAEAQREKGIVESLIAEQNRLLEARNRATNLRDVQRYNQELARTGQQLRTLQGVTASATAGMGQSFRTLSGLVSSAFGIVALQRFGKGLLEAGDNAQSFQVAMETMLGSKEKADKINAQAIALAAKTPFTLQEVQQQVKGLSAYGIAAEELIPTVTRLGNISAGVGKEKLPFLTLAYGQVRTAGRLTGQELRQFTEAGVPMLELLRNQSGKTTNQLLKDMKDGAIGFSQVEKAIASTSEKGGKFYNLMDKNSALIGGKISNFSDVVHQAFVSIEKDIDNDAKAFVDWGTQTVKELFGSQSALQRTYQFVKTAVAAWVTYRAVLLANTIQTRLASAETLGLVGTQRLLFVATNNANLATKGLFATLRANPIGVVVTLLGLAYTAYQAWKGVTAEVTSALGEQEAKIRSEQEALRAQVGQVLATNANTQIRIGLIASLRAQYPDLLKGLDDENVKNSVLIKALTAVNRQYRDKIALARIAYNVEKNAEAQKSLLEREYDAVARLKSEFPALKIVAQDLGSAIAEVEKSGAKTTYSLGANTVDKLSDYRIELRKLTNEQRLLDEAVGVTAQNQVEADHKVDVEKERNHLRDIRRREELKLRAQSDDESLATTALQELALVNARIKAYEDAGKAEASVDTTRDGNAKKWHNDALTRALNQAKQREEGHARTVAIIRAETDIEADKARFDKKTAAEILTIRLDGLEKIRKAEDEYVADAAKAGFDLAKDFFKNEEEKEKAVRESHERIRKLNEDRRSLETQLAATDAQRLAGEEVRERLKLATSRQARAALLAKYAKAEADLTISSKKVILQNLEDEYAALLKNGNLSVEAEKTIQNEILKAKIDVFEEVKKAGDEEMERVKKDEEEKRKNARETLSNTIQLLSQFEDASVKSFASMLTAYQQYLDAKEKGEESWKSKAMLAVQVVGAAAVGVASAFSTMYAGRLQQSEDTYRADKDALDKKAAAELENFRGTSAQKTAIEARQKKDSAALEAKYQKEQADLKTKQFNADKVAKIAQTVMAGALAAVESFAQLGLAGPIIVGALTAAQVALIASQKAPRFYFRGTEFVDREGHFPDGRDTVPSLLTRGERVVDADKNRQLGGMSNAALLKNALLGHRLESLPPGLHRFVLEGIRPENGGSRSERTDALLEQILTETRNQKRLTARIDKRGITLLEQQHAAEVRHLQTQYFG